MDKGYTYDSPIYSHWCGKLSEICDSEYGLKSCNHEKQLERSHLTLLSQSRNMQEFRVRVHAIWQKKSYNTIPSISIKSLECVEIQLTITSRHAKNVTLRKFHLPLDME